MSGLVSSFYGVAAVSHGGPGTNSVLGPLQQPHWIPPSQSISIRSTLPHIFDGMVPEICVPYKRRVFNRGKLASSDGILPEKPELSWNANDVNSVNNPISVGMDELMLFDEKDSASRPPICPISVGIVPVKLLLAKVSPVKAESIPNSVGIAPEILFSQTCNFVIEVSSPTSLGIGPSIVAL